MALVYVQLNRFAEAADWGTRIGYLSGLRVACDAAFEVAVCLRSSNAALFAGAKA